MNSKSLLLWIGIIGGGYLLYQYLQQQQQPSAASASSAPSSAALTTQQLSTLAPVPPVLTQTTAPPSAATPSGSTSINPNPGTISSGPTTAPLQVPSGTPTIMVGCFTTSGGERICA